ncbi:MULTISPECIES: hypothetical protein [unclassified Lysinibacillus]|uniref:hypothetical protein n=1 Tax=unclassified Lysinibacillus TaxID=2636778 RepID=UPI0038167D20
MYSKKQEQIINAKLKEAIKKVIEGENKCYFDEETTYNHLAIKSHSIWDSGILKLLSDDNNKIFWIDPKKRYKIFGADLELFQEIITKHATTYRGFCNEHDNDLFETIEKNNEYREELIQKFLYSYRASSYQHVQNTLSKQAYQILYEEIYKFSLNKIEGFNNRKVRILKQLIDLQKARDARGDKIFEVTKKIFQGTFKKRESSKVELERSIEENFILKSYKINKKIEFACSGIGDPLIDTKDRKIITQSSGFLFLNIFPKNENESYFILGLLRKDEDTYEDILGFLDLEYAKYRNNEVNIFLLVLQNLIINGSENIVMSRKLHGYLEKNECLYKLVNQFIGSIALDVNSQLYYQDLKKDHGYTLFV